MHVLLADFLVSRELTMSREDGHLSLYSAYTG